ncbi:MAG: PKD domain-containing protein, partial [Bacteroidia bacterium]|nr:PKD domain-containing protein [Bacteroidia bacterium]
VCLTVTATTPTGEQCRKQVCMDVVVNCETQPCPCDLSPNFQYNVTANCNYQFFGVSGGPNCLNVTYSWDFGDGTTGTGQNPSHVFPGPGIYVVCLDVIATTPTGEQCHKKICKDVVVTCGTQPCPCQLSPNFQYNVTSDCVFQFFGTSGAPACLNVSYTWDFGDGTTGSGPNPAHVFPGPGVYIVCLEVIGTTPTGEQCHKKICKEVVVTCGTTPCPCDLSPSFQYNVIQGCSLQFFGASGGPACLNVTYDWDFGDGTTGTGQNPAHTFPGPGAYVVCLEVTATTPTGEQCRKKICLDVIVDCETQPCPCDLSPNFQYNVTSDCVFQFFGVSGGPACLNLTYDWDFGDGTTASGQNPAHVFPGPGVYVVCLEVTGTTPTGEQCRKKICKEVVVNCGTNPCPCDLSPSFLYNPISPGCGLQFFGASGGPACLNVTYSWDFGDGTTGTGQNPAHTFPGPGAYVVCLEVLATTPTGEQCRKKVCMDVIVNCETTPCPCDLAPNFQYNVSEDCVFQFSGVSGGPACLNVIYNWDFGDGTTAIGQNPSHVFPGPGVYVVCLEVIATTPSGQQCHKKICKEIVVTCDGNPCPCDLSPSFQYNVIPGCSMQFFGASGGPACLNVTYNWDFGDGTTGTGMNPVHTFPGPGAYVVCLEVIATTPTGEQCRKKICLDVIVNCETQPCPCDLAPNFQYNVSADCVFQFFGVSGGPACLNVTYNWDFGDGTTGSGQNPSHVFPGPGVYVVCLEVIATTPTGEQCHKKICKDVVVNCGGDPCPCDLKPSFQYNVTADCVFQFFGVSGGPACLNVTYNWDFGDGTTGTGQNPSHIFPGPGVYLVCLEVIATTPTGEQCREKICKEIFVNCGQPCPCDLNPDFSYSINADCSISFSGISGGPSCLQNVTYDWNFGDGTTGSGQYPTHTFPGPGVYNVCLIVTAVNANGEECRKEICHEIQVNCDPPYCPCELQPDFQYLLSSSCAAYFEGFSGAPACLQILAYNWDFGDGTTGTGQTPMHVYAGPGVYMVCLEVVAMNASGQICIEKICKEIHIDCYVEPCPCDLKPEFTYSINADCSVSFQGISGGPQCLNVTYNWNFGDGTTGSGQYPVHTFPGPGIYVVCLEVTAIAPNGQICEKKICKEIYIDCHTDPCPCELKPDFKFAIDEQCNVYFEGASGGPACLQVVSYEWDFGDGTTGTGQYPVHVFPGPGTYYVCLTVTAINANGEQCRERYCEEIQIDCQQPPCPCDLKPSFTYSIDAACNVHFVGVSGGPACLQNVTYSWDFGDGTTGSGQLPTHTFPGPGVYNVCLTVTATNASGEVCRKQICKEIYIQCEAPPCHCELKPEFKYNIDSQCNVFFEAASGGPACLQNVTYTWDFGDGTTGSGQFPVHVFPGPGVYHVCVYVTAYVNGQVCEDKYCEDIVIHCEAPPCPCDLEPKFEYSIDELCNVHFEGHSGAPSCLQNVTYKWDFGDGTTGTGQNPIHTFPGPGVYYVCLIVEGTNGTEVCKEKYCEYVEVHCEAPPCPCDLKPEFNYTIDELCNVHFEGISGGPECLQIISYKWNFGDGTTYTGPNPVHTFPGPGVYTVCMQVTATNASGEVCKKKVCMDVVVQCEAPPCECRLDPEFKYGIDYAQCLVKFKGFSGGPACLQNVNYHWSFGDGTTSLGQEVGHIYTNPGTYYVCLVVTATTPDGNTCEEKYCEYVTVDCAGSCECKLEPQIFYQNNACEYTFTGVSGSNCVNITSYAWYVNGSGPYYGQTMTQVLSPTQGYQICLVVEGYTDQGECKKEVCEYIFNTDCYYNKGRSAGYDVELYPNPASEEVNIRFTEDVSGDVQVVLRTMEGKQLAVFKYAQASAGRELKVQLPAGISESLILAEIIAGENRVVKKIVIVKK